MMGSQSTSCAVCLATLLACAVPPSFAESYPTRPLRFMVGQAPGGQNDIMARLLGQKLAEALGQPVVIDNRPGAAGQLAFEIAAKAQSDGHTLVMGSISTLAVFPSMPAKPSYDVFRDFAPVTQISTSPYLVVVHPSLPVKSLAELVVIARERQGKLNYASSGPATGVHLTTELFKMIAGIDMTHIPYKGGAPATNDLIGGQVSVMFNNMSSAVPHVKTGRLRAIALTSPSRHAALPEVPTVAESGYPGFESGSWNGVVVRAGTPRPIVARLNQETIRAVRAADVRAAIENLGNTLVAGSPEAFANYIKSEMAKWAKVIRVVGLKADQVQ